jgi:hypothetical protein
MRRATQSVQYATSASRSSGRSAEVAGVAALGALAVLLPVARRPQVVRVLREHLHELAARAHQPVVVQREDDRDLPSRRLAQQRRREVVEVPDVDDVRLHAREHLREALVDAGGR